MSASQTESVYAIPSTAALADRETRTLKHGETFGLFNRSGDIRPLGFEDHGIYHQGTRFLSRLALKIESESPLLLNSAVREDNALLVIHLSNPDLVTSGGQALTQGMLYLRRSICIHNGTCLQSILMANYSLAPFSFCLRLLYEADFRDLFEIRGMRRSRTGTRLAPAIGYNSITIACEGLDRVTRETRILFSRAPSDVSRRESIFSMDLQPREEQELEIAVMCGPAETAGQPDFGATLELVSEEYRTLTEDETAVVTSNESFNVWINRSLADFHMLLTHTEKGLYPFAGIPWYSAVFGRDGIITALETLWINPGVAKGVLEYLACRQADRSIPEREAEPGKILHEERKGEMAALGEIPFGSYYGTADATPLFVVLAGWYFERTGDRNFLKKLWPAVDRALDWMRNCGDRDGDGFIEYARRGSSGLENQGWKDSNDSVFHTDGSLAEPPVALCEVQCYAYEALGKAALIAEALGKAGEAARLKKEAEELRRRFHATFWDEETGLYVLALDREKKRCAVRTSNAGHSLFSGIAPSGTAKRLVDNLLGDRLFSGWGIRTVGAGEARYNPLSYHNGSVWPHDNALIAFGMGRYGYRREAMKILTAMFDASGFMNLRRLPELFCGFPRRTGEGPTLYPVACAPQAWASGAAFLLLQACIGLDIQATKNRIYFRNPALPDFLQEVRLTNLRVGASRIDLSLQRQKKSGDVGVMVRRKEGDVEIVVTK